MSRRALTLTVAAALTLAGWAAALWGSWVAGRDIERAERDAGRDRGDIEVDLIERLLLILAVALGLLVVGLALTMPDIPEVPARW